AEKLHTTQAAVSSRIATLEQDFGARLFDRGSREVTLTQDGTKVLVYAEDRKSTRLNSSHDQISYAVFCLKKKTCQVYRLQPGFKGRTRHHHPLRPDNVPLEKARDMPAITVLIVLVVLLTAAPDALVIVIL